MHNVAAGSVCSLSQPKSDISDFGHLRVPNSGKPEFGWEREFTEPVAPLCIKFTGTRFSAVDLKFLSVVRR